MNTVFEIVRALVVAVVFHLLVVKIIKIIQREIWIHQNRNVRAPEVSRFLWKLAHK